MVSRVQAAELSDGSAGGSVSLSTATVGPNPSGIMVETVGQPDRLDTALDYETSGGMIIENVYETLLFFNGVHADQVVPWLAHSYDLSPDGLTYTFHLRSGITFHDGTAFDANAVYFSLMRAMIIDDPYSPAWELLQVVRGGRAYSKQYNGGSYGSGYTWAELNDFLNAKPIEVLDPSTVAIHLDYKYVAFPFIIAFTVSSIMSPTAFIAHWTAPTDPNTPYIPGATAGDYSNQLNPWPATNMVGTGPYMLDSWDTSSQTLTLVRNNGYWGGPAARGVAPIPRVVIKGVSSVNTRNSDCKNGATDICSIPVSSIFQFIDQKAWSSLHNLVPLSDQYNIYPKTGLWSQLQTNFGRLNERILAADGSIQAFQPFQDTRIREAFVLSFDRNTWLHKSLQDFAIPATQILPPGMFGYDTTLQPTSYDTLSAKNLLIDAGTHPIIPQNAFSPSNPQTVIITYGSTNAVYQAAATMIANAVNAMNTGLKVKTQPDLAIRRAAVSFIGWIVDYVDPDDFLVPFADGTAGLFAKQIAYNDAAVTALVKHQSTLTDPNQRLLEIKQIEEGVDNDWAYLWLTYPSSYAISRSWLEERPNAYVPGGIETFNPALGGRFYFFEINLRPQMTVSYQILGGGSPTPPSLSYVLNGVAKVLKLKTTPASVWADRGSAWSVSPNPLGGSPAMSQWVSTQVLTGTAASTLTIVFTYYRQYLMLLSYSTAGGGSGYSPPKFTATSLGVSTGQPLTNTPTGYWFDAGSTWTLSPNPLTGSGSSEQWFTSQKTSGKITGSSTLVFTYQHRFYLTMVANPSSAGTASPTSGWQNAGATVTISANPKPGHTFTSWTGTGTKSYTGTSKTYKITMNSAITETGNFS